MNQLIFIYQADGGFFNGLTDYVHKIVRPETYACQLCAITYGAFGMKREWKSFLDSLDMEMVFLHRDDCGDRYADVELPTVYHNETCLIGGERLSQIQNLTELIDALRTALKKLS